MNGLPSGTVTFLFTDVEGSTRLWEEYPEAMQATLARHDEILRDAIIAHDGHIVKTTGDGVHAAFATAGAAARAATDAQYALTTEPWGETGELRVRMGIHTGPAEQRDGDYYGTALNRAARLMSVAHGKQILVSLATEELLADELDARTELVDLGEHELRDLATPVRVFQLVHPDLPSDFPPLRSLDSFRGNLPVQATSFVGREEELAAVGDALRDARLVSITGVGGVGKTRLAAQVAADVVPRFRDGAWMCELAAASDPDALHQVVAASLGVPPRAGLAPGDAIVEFLQAKELLLVLDNCEHLLDAVGALAAQLIRRCAGIRMLTTSREGLGVEGEQVWPLRSLDSGSSTELFAERGRAVKPALVIDAGNEGAVADICARLDGVPLAIELAAARVASMSPLEISRRLDERFRLLTGGHRTAVERHQTLRATVDWSYSVLDERDRTVFERLGVFAGGFDTEAAVAVATGDGIEEWDVVDALADLVAKSLVTSEDVPDGTTRYGMLETLRHYARERLEEHADPDAQRRLHAEHYASFAALVGEEIQGPDELAWRTRLRAELDNLRAAVTWSLDATDTVDAEVALRIIAALAVQQGYDPTLGIGDWAVRALDRLDATTPGRAQVIRAAAAYRIAMGGDSERAHDLAVEALGDGELSDSPWPSYASYALAYVEVNRGEHLLSQTIVERAILEHSDRIGPMALMTLHAVAGAGASWAGNREAAVRHARESLEFGRRAGSPSGITSSLFAYGVAMRAEDPAAARAALEESIALVEQGATPVVYGYALGTVASLRAQMGEHVKALRAVRDALEYAVDAGNEALVDQVCSEALPVFLAVGSPETGAILFPAAWLAWADSVESRPLRGMAFVWLSSLDAVLAALGEEGFARARGRANAMAAGQRLEYAFAEIDRLITELS